MQIVKNLVNKFIHTDFRGVDRNSVKYFQLLMRRVRVEGSYVNNLYNYYYSILLKCLNSFDVAKGGVYVELGSGYGFLQDYAKQRNISLIRTDVVKHSNLDQVVDAQKLPFEDETVSAIFMFGVLHHIKNTYEFFQEAQRVLKNKGAIIMIEPTSNLFAELMYKASHSEPFDKKAKDWIIPGDDPMTCANLALPEIIFKRDIRTFKALYPNLNLNLNKYHSPLLFQMSGAGPYKPPFGEKSYYLFRLVDLLLSPLNRYLGMFSTIVVTKEN